VKRIKGKGAREEERAEAVAVGGERQGAKHGEQ
jgi:hypothetical protein